MRGVPEKDKARIRVFYDASSPVYRELYGEEQKEKYLSISDKTLPLPKEVVLDVGCGVGLFAEFINRDVYYIGVDISLKSLYKAPRKRPDKIVDYIYCDIEAPPFREKSFDKVYSFTHIHHSPDPMRTINILTSLSRDVVVVTFLKKVFDNIPNIKINAHQIIDSYVDWIVIYRVDKYNSQES